MIEGKQTHPNPENTFKMDVFCIFRWGEGNEGEWGHNLKSSHFWLGFSDSEVGVCIGKSMWTHPKPENTSKMDMFCFWVGGDMGGKAYKVCLRLFTLNLICWPQQNLHDKERCLSLLCVAASTPLSPPLLELWDGEILSVNTPFPHSKREMEGCFFCRHTPSTPPSLKTQDREGVFLCLIRKMTYGPRKI